MTQHGKPRGGPHYPVKGPRPSLRRLLRWFLGVRRRLAEPAPVSESDVEQALTDISATSLDEQAAAREAARKAMESVSRRGGCRETFSNSPFCEPDAGATGEH